jgi:hypothetical protein
MGFSMKLQLVPWERTVSESPLKCTKELKKKCRRNFDYLYSCNGEVRFVWWNKNLYVAVGIIFDSIERLATAVGWNTAAKQKVGIPKPMVLKTDSMRVPIIMTG